MIDWKKQLWVLICSGLCSMTVMAQNDSNQSGAWQSSNGVTLFAQPTLAHYTGRAHRHYQAPNRNHEYYGSRKVDHGLFSRHASRQASGKKVFVFDPRRLKWFAYDRRGQLVASGRASGGSHYCHDVGRPCRTPVGEFSVHRKGSAYCKSNKYPLGRGGAQMPHCMFFKGGYAIHGSPDVPNHNASHGCIRVLPNAARWLHGNFIDHGTTVIVKPY